MKLSSCGRTFQRHDGINELNNMPSQKTILLCLILPNHLFLTSKVETLLVSCASRHIYYEAPRLENFTLFTSPRSHACLQFTSAAEPSITSKLTNHENTPMLRTLSHLTLVSNPHVPCLPPFHISHPLAFSPSPLLAPSQPANPVTTNPPKPLLLNPKPTNTYVISYQQRHGKILRTVDRKAFTSLLAGL